MTRSLVTRLTRTIGTALTMMIVLGACELPALTQDTTTSTQQDLKTRIEQRYEVLPLRDGVLLKSKAAQMNGSVELSGGRIAINGTEVTGAQLRQQLGADADLVLRLSYLEAPAQHALFVFGAPAVASPAASASASRATEGRRVRRSGAVVRFGSDVSVGPDEVRTDDVVVIGGNARIDGEVNGDVVVVGGRTELGPRAHVRRDLTVIGGTLLRDPGAVIDGDVNEIGSGANGFDLSRGSGRRAFARIWPLGGAMPFVRVVATALRIAALILLASIVILLGRQPIERIGARAASEPLKAGLVGLLIELLFLPALIVTVVLLVVTIIGIPLLALVPVALLAAVIVLLIGFTAVAYLLGERIAARFGWSTAGPYAATAVGIVVVFAPLLLARVLGVALGGLALVTAPLAVIGWVMEYSAWTIGLGAAALDRFRPAHLPTPTPEPAA
jgi:hypothetical protein